MEEQRQEQEQYRIAEFARMVGIDPSTIRYYEKQGLPGMRRSKNGYRVFDRYDAFQMNVFRSIYARGYSIDRALKRMAPTDLKTLIRELEENSGTMERERLLLEGRSQWMRETLDLLKKLEAGEEMLWRIDLEDHYYLPASHLNDFSITQKNGRVRSAWEEWLGYTRFVALGDSVALGRGEWSVLSLGEAVGASAFERLGYPMDDTARHLPMGECLCFPSQKVSQGGGPPRYGQVLDYMEKHGLEPWGHYLEFYLMFYTGEDIDIDGIIALPVRQKK